MHYNAIQNGPQVLPELLGGASKNYNIVKVTQTNILKGDPLELFASIGRMGAPQRPKGILVN